MERSNLKKPIKKIFSILDLKTIDLGIDISQFFYLDYNCYCCHITFVHFVKYYVRKTNIFYKD